MEFYDRSAANKKYYEANKFQSHRSSLLNPTPVSFSLIQKTARISELRTRLRRGQARNFYEL